MNDKSLVGVTLTSEQGLCEAFKSPNGENYATLGDLNASHSPSLGDRRVASGRSAIEMSGHISAVDRPSPVSNILVDDSFVENIDDVSSSLITSVYAI